jgi:hypothetical protein
MIAELEVLGEADTTIEQIVAAARNVSPLKVQSRADKEVSRVFNVHQVS